MIEPTKFKTTRDCLIALHAALVDEDASYELEAEDAAKDQDSDLDDYQGVQLAAMFDRLGDSEHRPMFDIMRVQACEHIEYKQGLEDISNGD